MRTNQLALSRSATDRDAERRSEPGLLERLAADPETRLLLVDARGRVALTGPAIHPDLPDDGPFVAAALLTQRSLDFLDRLG